MRNAYKSIGSISMLPVYSMYLLHWISLQEDKSQNVFIDQKDKSWRRRINLDPCNGPSDNQTLSHKAANAAKNGHDANV